MVASRPNTRQLWAICIGAFAGAIANQFWDPLGLMAGGPTGRALNAGLVVGVCLTVTMWLESLTRRH